MENEMKSDAGVGGGVGGAATPAATPASIPQSVTMTIAGEEKTLTLDELKTMASKAAGADARFREAAAMRLEAESAMRLKEVFDRANSGDPQGIRDLAVQMGEDPEDVEAFLESMKNGGGEAAPEARLNADQERRLKLAEQVALERTREKTLEEMNNFLDKDAYFGQDNFKTPQARTALMEVYEAEVVSRLARREPYNATLLAQAAQKVRTLVQSLGVGTSAGSSSQESKVEAAKRLQIGLGLSEGATFAAIQAGKPIPRVEVNDPDYVDNFVARAMLSKSTQS